MAHGINQAQPGQLTPQQLQQQQLQQIAMAQAQAHQQAQQAAHAQQQSAQGQLAQAQPGQPQPQTPQQQPQGIPGAAGPPQTAGPTPGQTPAQVGPQMPGQAHPPTPQQNQAVQQAQLQQVQQQHQAMTNNLLQQQQQKREGMKGHCLLKLMQFGEHLSGFPGTQGRDDLSYWNDFVSRFFSPKAIFRYALHLVENEPQSENKQYEITYPALARYFHTHFDSGVKTMQLIMEKGTTDRPLPQDGHYIENQKASLVYWFEEGSHVGFTLPQS
jgi:hypothetical protein